MKQRKVGKIGIKLKKAVSEQEEDSSDWEIPENLNNLFSVFHKFVQDTHTESSDEVEDQNQQHYQQQYLQLDPSAQQKLELQHFYQSLETDDERRIWEYLLNQNVTDPASIRAFIDQIQASALKQQENQEIQNPEAEIERSQRAIENLNALQHENLRNNLNYTLQNENQNNQLLAYILNEALNNPNNIEALKSLLPR